MKPVVIAVIVVAVLVAVVLARRSRSRILDTATPRATVADIPRILAAMSASKASPVFVVFIFNTPGRPSSDDAVNVQFSVEGGRAGLDWVLLGRNIEDQAAFTALARTEGFEVTPMEANNTRYLRVENGDIARLCREVIVTMYRWPQGDPIDLVVEGFEWTSSQAGPNAAK